MRLPLERFAFEIADGLPDLCDDRAIRSSMKAHRLEVRTDHGPLARPVLAYGLAAMDVATIHTVGPGDIIGEHGQHAVYVPRVKAIVDALRRSSHITLTEVAEARLPDAVAALFRGHHEVLRDFTDEEAGLLVDLLTRLIANLDRVASVEASPGTPIFEKGD